MEKSKYLKLFRYDPESFDSIKDRIVTWDENKVDIVYKFKTKNKILAVISKDDEEIVNTYNFDGVTCNMKYDKDSDEYRLYIDSSDKVWVNISKDSDNSICISKPFKSEYDARMNRDDKDFDTISIRVI